jgi:hypothetical protein
MQFSLNGANTCDDDDKRSEENADNNNNESENNNKGIWLNNKENLRGTFGAL